MIDNPHTKHGGSERKIHQRDDSLIKSLQSMKKSEKKVEPQHPDEITMNRLKLVLSYINDLQQITDNADENEQDVLEIKNKLRKLKEGRNQRLGIISEERSNLRAASNNSRNHKRVPTNGYANGGSGGNGKVFTTGGRVNPRAKRS